MKIWINYNYENFKEYIKYESVHIPWSTDFISNNPSPIFFKQVRIYILKWLPKVYLTLMKILRWE